MEELKYNYFTVYLAEYLEDFKRYRFFKKGVECFTPENQIVYKSETLITSKEFEETIIKGTKYSMVSSKNTFYDLKEQIENLLKEVSCLNKQAINKKFIIDINQIPFTIDKNEYENMLTNVNKHLEITNIPMKQVENNLFNAFMWLNVDSYIKNNS